jgi:hypothetical protein
MIEFFELLHVRFDFDGALEKLAVCGACCSCHLFVLLSLHAPEVCERALQTHPVVCAGTFVLSSR